MEKEFLKGKKLIIIGDRDGVHGEEIEAAVKSMGYDVAFSCTECFVCTAAGSVDFSNQQKIREIAEGEDPKKFVALLGVCGPDGALVHSETVTRGDPSKVGALADISLRLPVYHAFEPEFKSQIDEKTYSDTIGMIEKSLPKDDIEKIIKVVREVREKEVLE